MSFDPTGIFTFLDDLALLGEKLSDSINDLIKTTIPSVQMHQMIKRVKRVQRLCRHEHLPATMIRTQVDLLFADQNADFRATISTQIIFVLQAK